MNLHWPPFQPIKVSLKTLFCSFSSFEFDVLYFQLTFAPFSMFQLKVEKPSDVFVSGPAADLTVNPGHNHMENRYTGTKVLLREMSEN